MGWERKAENKGREESDEVNRNVKGITKEKKENGDIVFEKGLEQFHYK